MIINSLLNYIKSGLKCNKCSTKLYYILDEWQICTNFFVNFRGHLFQIDSMSVAYAAKPKQLCCDQVVRRGVAVGSGPLAHCQAQGI